MRRVRSIAALLFATIALTGCTLTVGGGTTTEAVTATQGRGGAVAGDALAPGEVLWYRVSLPATAPSVQAAYFELNKNLNLSLYVSNQSTLYATSHSPDFFARNTMGLAGVGIVPSPQSIAVRPLCAGSCIVHAADASTFYVRIANQTAATTSFSLYAYVEDYQDSNETLNNTLGSAVNLAAPQDDQGAVEVLGDRDFYTFSTSGQFQLTGCSGGWVDLVANLYHSGGGGAFATLLPGDPAVSVTSNDYAIVESDSGNYASQATACSYYASLQ